MFQKEIFQKRLKQLRENHPTFKTQKEFSEFIEVSQPTLVSYERGTGKPPIDVLCNIAEKCNVSISWLCGLNNVQANPGNLQTYSSIIELLAAIGQSLPLEVHTSSFDESAYLNFNNPVLYRFFDSWASILSLYQSGKIKLNLYNLWLADELEKYNFDIHSEADTQIFLSENPLSRDNPDDYPY